MTAAPGSGSPESPGPVSAATDSTHDEARAWRRVDRLFEAVLDRPEAERPEFLEREAGGDEGLRREVERLLDADRRAGTFLGDLEERGGEKGENAAPAVDEGPPRERRVGAYRLLRVLGRGGMGTVYLAARDDDEYRRLVAVKVMREGLGRPEALSRFRRERQILADLEHPAVARLYDGGTTPEGRPFLVMEHVDGVPIDVYADRERLSLDERLRLFLRVCEAVQFTHQNLLVHRDLKPNNILVRADGEPVLLDFGIAKLLAPEAQDRQGLTQTGRHLMTPSYASPEQVEGGAITTAADLYALGVLLYELLSGSSPYRDRDGSPAALIAAIREDDPPLPSAAAAGAGDGSLPGLDRAVVARRLAGDLDAIVMKALRKEPSRRYASVAELAADLRRYRDDQPVEARRGSRGYRMGKFVRRHRVAVAVGAGVLTVLLALLAILAAQTVELRREREEADLQRQAAEREREKAQEALGVMVDVFRHADPGAAEGETLTARALLDRGAARILGGRDRDPEVRATLLVAIGEALQGLGRADRAEPVVAEALRLRRELYGERHPATLEALREMGEVAYSRGDLEQARRILQTALERQEAVSGESSPAVAETLFQLAGANGRLFHDAEAEAQARRAAEIFRAGPEREHQLRLLDVEELLAEIHFHGGDLETAEAELREVLAGHRELGVEDRTQLLNPLSQLALVLTTAGRYEEAIPLHEESLEIWGEIYGDRHPEVITVRQNLAYLIQMQGRLEEAEGLYRGILEDRRAVLGPDHPKVAVTLNNLGDILQQLGRFEEALEMHRESLEIRRRAFGEDSRTVGQSLIHIAWNLGNLGRFDEAHRQAAEALELVKKNRGPDHVEVGYVEATQGNLYLLEERWSEAGAKFETALERFRAVLPPGHRRILDAESKLGACRLGQGRRDEAAELLTRSYEALLAAEGESSPTTRAARERLDALGEAGSGG